MKKVNLTKISFITIDCDKCKNDFRVYVNENWECIKDMKISEDKNLMFSCPYCDNSFIQQTDFKSVCIDKDEESLKMKKMIKEFYDYNGKDDYLIRELEKMMVINKYEEF